MGLVHRLYHGETTFPLIKDRKRFYAASLILCVVALGSLVFRGLNLGVEFKGGAIFTLSAPSNVDVHAARTFMADLNVGETIVQTVKTSNGDTKLRVETAPLSQEQEGKVLDALAQRYHVDRDSEIDSREVGA